MLCRFPILLCYKSRSAALIQLETTLIGELTPMPVVTIRLPETETSPQKRPERCPYCSCEILQSWGQLAKNLQDIQNGVAEVHRYRCSECGRTFRQYPQGVDRSVQSQRMRKMAALAYVIGLSSRDVVSIFKQLGFELSRMTVWREGREFARSLQEHEIQSSTRKYSLDHEYLHGISSRFGVVVVLDAGGDKRAVLGTLDEFNPRQVKKWLEAITSDFDFKVTIVSTDILSPPTPLVPDPGGALV